MMFFDLLAGLRDRQTNRFQHIFFLFNDMRLEWSRVRKRNGGSSLIAISTFLVLNGISKQNFAIDTIQFFSSLFIRSIRWLNVN